MKAISLDAVSRFGCPECGYRFCRTIVSLIGATYMKCNSCQTEFLVLCSGIKKIRFGENVFRLEPHPRQGSTLCEKRMRQSV